MAMEPRATYDPEADALDVRLSENPIARTVTFDDAHLVDLDADGAVVALEILTPADPKVEELAARFGISDVDLINAAIRRAQTAASGSLLLVLDESVRFALQYSLVGFARDPVTATGSGAENLLEQELEPAG